MTSDSRQQDLFADLPRSRQHDMIRELELPDFKIAGQNIPKFTLKSILFRIHDRANPRCWVSQKRLAKEANCSVKTVERASRALEAMGLIVLDEESVKDTNEYSINWGTVGQMIRGKASTTPVESNAETKPAINGHLTKGVRLIDVPPQDSETGGCRLIDVPPYVCETGGVRLLDVQTKENQSLKINSSSSEMTTKVFGDGWDLARRALEGAGVKLVEETIRDAKLHHITPVEIVDASFVCKSDSRLDPGAICWWVTHGREWPVENVLSAASWRDSQERKKAHLELTATNLEREQIRGKFIKSRVRAGHRPTDAEIQHHLEQTLNAKPSPTAAVVPMPDLTLAIKSVDRETEKTKP